MFLKASFLALDFSKYTLMTLLIILSVNLLTCGWSCCLLQIWSGFWFVATAKLASKLGSALRGTMDWDRKWLVAFNAGKTQLLIFDRSNNRCAIDVEMDESILLQEIISNYAGFAVLCIVWLGLLHCLYCERCLQQSERLDSFYEICFYWCYSISL